MFQRFRRLNKAEFTQPRPVGRYTVNAVTHLNAAKLSASQNVDDGSWFDIVDVVHLRKPWEKQGSLRGVAQDLD